MKTPEYDCTLDLPISIFRSLNRQKRYYCRILSELRRERFDVVDRLISQFTLKDLNNYMDGDCCSSLLSWAINHCVPVSILKYWSKIIPKDLFIETLKERNFLCIRTLVRIIENKKSVYSSLHQDYSQQKIDFLIEFGDEEIRKLIQELACNPS